MKRFARVLGVALAAGVVAGGLMGYVAARHNAQGEFSDAAGRLSIGLLMPVVFSWFLIVFLLVLGVGIAWGFMRRALG